MKKQHLFLLSLLLAWLGAMGASAQSCPDNNHPHMIDLGLPSGTKWSCCNVGVTSPTAIGGYYSWGETEEKTNYNSYNYQYNNTNIGSNISCTEYDAAYVKSNGRFCMPSNSQLQELVDNCSHEIITVDNVKGIRFSSNGASIFLPYGGYNNGTAIQSLNSMGRYWSDSQNSEKNNWADYLVFGEDLGNSVFISNEYRSWGHNIRPVENTSPTTQKEAYAVLSTDKKTLTFYFDYLKSSRTGTVYNLNTAINNPGWYSNSSSVTSVVFDASFADARPTSCSSWFSGMTNLTSITDIGNLKTDEVTNMYCMFSNCSSLTSIDVSHFDTSKVTDMSYMFAGCSELTSIDVSGFDTSKVTDISRMFYNCSGIKILDLSSFTFNSGVAADLFLGDTSLEALSIPATSNNLPEGAFEAVGTDHPVLLYYPKGFSSQGSTTPDENGFFEWKAGYFKMAYTEAYAVLSTDGKTLTFYYDRMRVLRQGTTYDLNTGSEQTAWYRDGKSKAVEKVVFDASFKSAYPRSCAGWFWDMENLRSIQDLKNLDTYGVTDMSGMFYGCSSLTSLDLSSFYTYDVETMNQMFANCYKLESIKFNLNDFNASNVTDMESMFSSCTRLTSLDLSHFDLSNVTKMNGMFRSCTSLKTLAIPSTAESLNDDVFNGVGKASEPCTLICPAGYSPQGATQGSGYIRWKGGYFNVLAIPYAVLSTDGKTLTFYYDKNSTSRQGTKYDLNAVYFEPKWLNYSDPTVETVVFDATFASVRPTNCYKWFSEMDNLTSIQGIKNLNTSEVTSMYGMFDNCTKLASLDLSYFNTAKVANMSRMFCFCSSLESLDLSSFKTANVTDMRGMFLSCSSLESLDLSSFNTANVTDMRSMFAYCSGLTSLDLSSFNTAKVTDMNSMFYNCNALTSLDLSSFNTAKVTDMNSMFYDCYALTSLDLSSFNTANVTDMRGMFDNCSKLTSLDLSSFNTAKVTDMSSMFFYCYALTSLDLSNFTFNNGIQTVYFLYSCSGLKTLTIPASAHNLNSNACSGVGAAVSPCKLICPEDFTPKDATQGNGYIQWKGGYFTVLNKEAYAVLSTDGNTLTFFCDTERASRQGTTYDMNTENHAPGWSSSSSSVTTVLFDASFADARPTSCCRWFYGMKNLTTITGIENLKTDEVTNMRFMFGLCTSLTSLDVSGFNTAKVTDMQRMFYYCSQLTSLDVSSFNTANVTDMSLMFSTCLRLTSLDVSRFNTANANMNYMFQLCGDLTDLDLSSFTFNNGIATDYLLYSCSGLKTLTIPASAGNLNPNAFLSVASAENPCLLITPDDFTPDGTEQYDGYFIWKGGYFTAGLPGDANSDNTVTVADVMLTVNKVMKKTVTSFNERNADINNDGNITVADVMGIVKLVLNSGRASAPRNAYQTMSDAMAVTAKGATLTLHLTGTGTYTASQMTLTLPEGCRLEGAQMVSSRSNGHSVLTSDLGNGQYRVVVYGISGLPFGNSCSDLVRLNVKGNHNGDVAVSDIQVVDYHANTVLLSDVSGIATGIDSIGYDSEDGDWYTTQGQKVATPTRGVYIRNGKKVVVK